MVFKGTQRRSAKQLALELEVRGGSLDAYTGRDYTSYQAHTLDAGDEIVEGSLAVGEAGETSEPEAEPEAETEAEAEVEVEAEAEAPAEDEPAAQADTEVVAEAAREPEPEPEADSAES
jgi:hypothetical protein